MIVKINIYIQHTIQQSISVYTLYTGIRENVSVVLNEESNTLYSSPKSCQLLANKQWLASPLSTCIFNEIRANVSCVLQICCTVQLLQYPSSWWLLPTNHDRYLSDRCHHSCHSTRKFYLHLFQQITIRLQNIMLLLFADKQLTFFNFLNFSFCLSRFS